MALGKTVEILTCHRKNSEVREWVKVLKQRYAGMKMIVGRDKLDEVQVREFACELRIPGCLASG